MKKTAQTSELFRGEDFSDLALPEKVRIVDMTCSWSAGHDTKNQLFVNENMSPSELISNIADLNIKCIVQRRENYFKEDILRSSEVITSPHKYFQSHGQSLLKESSKVLETKFSQVQHKENAVKQIESFCVDIKSQSLAESTRAIFEELFMNALYDAPRESKSYLIGDSDSYLNRKSAVVRIFKNNNRMVISCEDPFGSMKLDKLIDRMQEVYRLGLGPAMNMKESAGGAGIGTVIIFEHCESLFVGVEPGQKTLVSCVLPIGLSLRQRDALSKTIHIIEVNSNDSGGTSGKS